MKWADLSTAAKLAVGLTTGAVSTVAGVVGWMFLTFETAAAAEQKWQAHNQAIACRTVYEMQKEIRDYLRRLELDKSLDLGQAEWIKQEIRALQEEIRRLDPNGVC